MDLQLSGKKAIVTGCTQGIGRSIAECFLREGVDVAICAREPVRLAETVKQLKTFGPRIFAASVDVRDEPKLRAWVRSAAESLGGIDIVVSNVSAASGDWRAMFETDLMAAKNLAEEALPFLEKSKAASFLAISSRAAYTGEGAYAAMKCALMSYLKGLSDTWAPRQIRVNVVSPGDIYFKDGFWDRMLKERPDVWSEAQLRNKLGRLGTPEEVARVVVFVSSPAASFMSGANVRVDGAGTASTQF